ncbi:alpha/beta-hydrolase [Piptocephalis cylindrospora]|uniref:Alpha/beta-hydrolase n=1 Tax=Piptocephalis cylindrospora TaxID=1907219 RepID=A0A4P9Y5F0_9FUNG|nr:alpha/beta-hydrolase [Piptocephalis cylindrospora]|eukprot:RKP14173.1 alpha/beta-hydrolase [Piptocephalis cylindrospora]
MLHSVRHKGHCKVGEHEGSNPTQLYYEVHGSGPHKILFIMGLCVTGDAWEEQVKYFVGLGDFTVCIFDNRGVGKSGTTKGPYSTSGMAMDTRDLLNHLGWTADVHIVGMSLGGMIALEIASAAPPGLLKSLTLTSTHAGLTVPPVYGAFASLRAMFIGDVQRRFEINADILYPQEWLKRPCPADSPYVVRREEVVHVMKQRFIHSPVQPTGGTLGQLSAVLRHHIGKGRLSKIRDAPYPVLVLTGAEDNLIRPSNSRYLAGQLDGQLEVYSGAGHALPYQEADRYNQTLLTFFRKAEGQEVK